MVVFVAFLFLTVDVKILVMNRQSAMRFIGIQPRPCTQRLILPPHIFHIGKLVVLDQVRGVVEVDAAAQGRDGNPVL